MIHPLYRVALGGQPLHTCHISGPRPHPGGDQERRDPGGGQEWPHHAAGTGKILLKITPKPVTCVEDSLKVLFFFIAMTWQKQCATSFVMCSRALSLWNT